MISAYSMHYFMKAFDLLHLITQPRSEGVEVCPIQVGWSVGLPVPPHCLLAPFEGLSVVSIAGSFPMRLKVRELVKTIF